eukprot:gene182-64_t
MCRCVDVSVFILGCGEVCELSGSPRYMAPEMFDFQKGVITEAVDVWAMACSFVEIFGGTRPYIACKAVVCAVPER